MAVFVFGSGCSSAQPKASNTPPTAPSPSPVPKLTKITKDDLKARLGGKNVQFIDNISDNEKPNPLFLMVKIAGSGADGKAPLMATLNGESRQGVGELVTKLRSIFKMRTDQGVFQEGKNEVDKRLNIAASDRDITFYNKESIYIEDFEKLISDLQKEGIDQIYVNFAESGEPAEINIDDLKVPLPQKPKP